LQNVPIERMRNKLKAIVVSGFIIYYDIDWLSFTFSVITSTSLNLRRISSESANKLNCENSQY